VEATIPSESSPLVFDVHQHYGTVPGWSDHGAASPVARDVAERVEMMDRHGIDIACVQPATNYGRADTRRAVASLNDAVREFRDEAPERFPVALGTVDLCVGGGDVLDETRRALDDLALAGIAWHHRLQGVYIDDERMRPVLEEIEGRDKVAAVHLLADSTFESPWRLERLADAHPRLRFLALDCFSSYEHACWMGWIARRFRNIVFDTAAMVTNANILARFVTEAGSERLVFGSNLYGAQQTDYYPAALYALRASSEIGDVGRELILGKNALALFGLDRAGVEQH
jgi:uncharacterized protein